MSVLTAALRGASSRSGQAVGRILQQEEIKRQTAEKQAAAEAEMKQAALDRMFGVATSIAEKGGPVPPELIGQLGPEGAGLGALADASKPKPKTGTIPEGFMFDGEQLVPIPGYVEPEPEIEYGPVPRGYQRSPDGVLSRTPGWEEGVSKEMFHQEGLLLTFKDGTTQRLTPEDAEALHATLNKKNELWMAQEDKRQSNRMELSSARYWQSVDLKMKDVIIEAQTKVMSGLSMEDGEDMIRAAAIGLPEDRVNALIAAAMPLLSDNELKIDWSGPQIDKLTDLNAQTFSAQRVIELGQNDIVRSELGRLSNVWSNIDEYLGGKHFSEEARDFLYWLKNTQDNLQRSRTGAAISEFEKSFYDEMFGTVYTDVDVILNRMEELQDFSRTTKDAMWSTRLSLKYEKDPAARERAWKKYEERERRMLGFVSADRDGPVLQDIPAGSMTDEDIDALMGGGE